MPQIFHRSTNTISKVSIFGAVFIVALLGWVMSVFARSAYVTNVGITLALDDFTDENGATQALPYSQQRLEPPGEAEFERDAVRLMPRAGQAIMFNARIWHRGGINRSAQPRHAVTINACRSFMRQRFDYPRLVPPALVDELGPVGRRFLGFNVRMPTSLEEYYVPEDRRLYKAGQG